MQHLPAPAEPRLAPLAANRGMELMTAVAGLLLAAVLPGRAVEHMPAQAGPKADAKLRAGRLSTVALAVALLGAQRCVTMALQLGPLWRTAARPLSAHLLLHPHPWRQLLAQGAAE